MTLPTVFCLMGPTATGKTQIALELAQQFPCDIISVDSALVYRGMDIGTAKPTPAELRVAPHRLIDILDPAEPYSAGRFCADAQSEITRTLAVGRIPLLVGGTMLYFRALQQGLSPLPSANPAIRDHLTHEAQQLGWLALHQRLEAIDPVAASRINPQDTQRISRALEVYLLTGMSFTDFCQQAAATPPMYRMINLGLMVEDREKLAEKIQQRFMQMLKQGFVEEVIALRARGDLQADMPSMRAVGYRQIWQYLAGDITANTMQEQAIIATRQLAKRQMTWLRSWPEITFFAAQSTKLWTQVQQFMGEKLNSLEGDQSPS